MEFAFEAAKLEQWLQTTPRDVRAACIRALRRTGTAVQGQAVELFRQRGIGRTVFGKKASGARKLIQRGKIEERQGVLVQPIKVKGLAAIQELGGRTKQHTIKPKLRKALRFGVTGVAGFGGDAVYATEVQHPGSSMPAMPYLARAAERERERFRVALETELQKVFGRRAA